MSKEFIVRIPQHAIDRARRIFSHTGTEADVVKAIIESLAIVLDGESVDVMVYKGVSLFE